MSEDDVTLADEVEPEEPEEESDEGDDEDDDDDGGRSVVITSDQYRMHRIDALEAAYNWLKSKSWGDYTIDPPDVVITARFLDGDGE